MFYSNGHQALQLGFALAKDIQTTFLKKFLAVPNALKEIT